jgi:antitoxin MazE
MVKKLSAIGNSLGLVIEKPILDLLNIDRDTELEVTTDGKRLIVEPVDPGRKRRIAEAIKRATKKHEKTLRRLAE